jgi:hypothetical protein
VLVETFDKVSAPEWFELSYNYLRFVDINNLRVLPKLPVLKLKLNLINEIIPATF